MTINPWLPVMDLMPSPVSSAAGPGTTSKVTMRFYAPVRQG